MEGTLWKWTNYFSGWQPRWFILDNGILSYYKSQDDVNNGCKGSIKMAVCDVNVHPTDTTRLDLIIPGEAHFYVKSATAQERQQWLVALGSCKACLTTTGRPAAESDEVISTDQLKVKKSELRLYCDLLMQQVHSVKSAVTEETAPDVEKLDDATSLLKATCDTFIRTLEDCMKIANAKATYEPVSKSTIQRSQSADKYLSSAATTLNQESNVRSGKFGSQRSHSDSAAVNGHLSEEYFYENYHVEIEKKNSENYDSANYDSDSSPKNKDSSNNVFQNDAIESKKYPTFFNTMSASFADVILQEDSKIPVQPFLDACRSILPIFDKLGSTAFAPVKMDISGNVKKIHQKYITNPELFQTLQDIMVYEVKAQHHHVSNSATTAILWLKRALEFISEFIAEVAEGKPDLAECANNAYSKTLRPYHGWVVRGVFGVAMRSLPYRKDFLLHLAMSEEDFEQPDFIEQLTKNMQDYSTAEDKILHVLQDYLHAHNLNSDAEV